jgi:hypothetical protein
MNRLGLSHTRNDAISSVDIASPAKPAPQEVQQATPKAGDTVYEIGVILALHLAFAFAVLLTLQAFGVS